MVLVLPVTELNFGENQAFSPTIWPAVWMFLPLDFCESEMRQQAAPPEPDSCGMVNAMPTRDLVREWWEGKMSLLTWVESSHHEGALAVTAASSDTELLGVDACLIRT